MRKFAAFRSAKRIKTAQLVAVYTLKISYIISVTFKQCKFRRLYSSTLIYPCSITFLLFVVFCFYILSNLLTCHLFLHYSNVVLNVTLQIKIRRTSAGAACCCPGHLVQALHPTSALSEMSPPLAQYVASTWDC